MVLRLLAAGVAYAGLLLVPGGPVAQHGAELSVSAQPTGEGIFEISVEGSRFWSRDAVERELLVETAKVTLRNEKDWFRLLEMPGESSGTHPVRPVPQYGEKYRAWHPQWAYRLKGEGWQRWRPEWGATFWADSVDSTKLVAFQASGLVLLGTGPRPGEGDVFEARAVLEDLSRTAD